MGEKPEPPDILQLLQKQFVKEDARVILVICLLVFSLMQYRILVLVTYVVVFSA